MIEVTGSLGEAEMLIKLFLLECAAEQGRVYQAFRKEHLLVELCKKACLRNLLEKTKQRLIPFLDADYDIFHQKKDFRSLIYVRRL